MTPAADLRDIDNTSDPILGDLVEEFTNRVQAGEAVEVDGFARAHPERADQLRRLLPTLHVLADVGRAAGAEGASGIPGGTVPDVVLGQLGDYRLVRVVGRGGMGVVYEAEQVSLGRRVALKVLPFAGALDARQLQRFKVEAQAAAHLHHTNIVPVFAVGCQNGVHYYAMQFIEGQTLAALIRELRQLAGLDFDHAGGSSSPGAPPRELVTQGTTFVPAKHAPPPVNGSPLMSPVRAAACATVSSKSPAAAISTQRWTSSRAFFRTVANLGVQAADALEHAHQLGVVHRDIKPANVLVNVQGNLWITDFGLARFQNDCGLTLSGDLLGTLRYMSPEQALARRGVVDHRTDIYSLGVTLYELATLVPAFHGRDRQELLRQIAMEDPLPPRRLSPTMPPELETILLKACAKNPSERYATAHELAEDLRRFLEDKPILAKRPTLPQRAAKWARRHRPLVNAVVLGMFLAVVALSVSTILIWQEKQQTDNALAHARGQSLLAKQRQAEADKALLQAEMNFRRAREAATEWLMQLQDERWARLPKIKEMRQAFAGQMLDLFKRFAEDNGTDPTTRLQRALAYSMMGSLYGMQGEDKAARQAHARAIAVLERLVAEFPHNGLYRHELGSSHHFLGLLLHEQGEYDQATAEFQHSLEQYRQALTMTPVSRTFNNLAWLLVTCPQAHLRNAQEAVPLAQRGVDMACPSSQRACWNTLGVAHYRAGHWKEAIKALETSVRLSEGGDSCDWFFLAMAHWQLGDKKQAHCWYQRGIKELVKPSTGWEPVCCFRDEAAALMGITQ